MDDCAGRSRSLFLRFSSGHATVAAAAAFRAIFLGHRGGSHGRRQPPPQSRSQPSEKKRKKRLASGRRSHPSGVVRRIGPMIGHELFDFLRYHVRMVAITSSSGWLFMVGRCARIFKLNVDVITLLFLPVSKGKEKFRSTKLVGGGGGKHSQKASS